MENLQSIIKPLKNGQVAVLPTDTIYGIVGLARNPVVVKKIYKLRKRSSDKPFIILISSIDDLEQFNVRLTDAQIEFLQKNWPNPLSVIFPCKSEEFKYLHRGTNSLAFRIPQDEKLLSLLKLTGPLVAPSANFEGEKPSENINQAKKYFGDSVDFYIDGGNLLSVPSTIIEFNDESKIKVLRQGRYKV